ncbi:MAG: phosphotransferase [Bryobacterales bacterium]|nr:phosphotransferase [Bryobacterales bacterium]
MFHLTTESFAEYAAGRPELASEAWRARLLGGGVSNTVMLAEGAQSGRRLVLKQALGQLRVHEVWLADQKRIHREAAAIIALAPLLPPGAAPVVAFEDRANFIYAMEAAPEGSDDWKTRLMRGEADARVARQAVAILNALARGTVDAPRWRAEFGDQHCFDQLRLDPYYRFTAARHPDLREAFEEAITLARRPLAMVHGDFSPKNLLVSPEGVVTLIDFEVIHYGDPAFDAAFLLNHLLLKAAHGVPGARELGRECAEALAWLEPDSGRHLGCLHLARVDGKSPAEYLTEAERARVRGAARAMIARPERAVAEWFAT